jgi:hypothetical protein
LPAFTEVAYTQAGVKQNFTQRAQSFFACLREALA